MTGETDTEIPETGAVFTFGKSKIANNVPSRLWLKNDKPVHISCGQSHSAFVTEQGRLFVFGNNNRGQLGLQTKGPVNKPVCVKVLKGEKAQFVACGTDHTLVSTSQGDIFAAGGNSDGQLGLGHCNDSISFQRLHPFCDYAPIKLLSAGGHTSAALTEDGRLFLWGDNSDGQLGLGNDSHALLPKELKLGQPIQWVSCGYRHSAVVTDNGNVFTFGESADGRLGLSAHQLANHGHPQLVESLHGVLQVACGGKHTLALTEDELYSFGRGEFGQLGLGTLVFVSDTPVAVGHFRKGRVTHVTCGENHSALITDSGLLYTFGDGRQGKLGHGDENFTNQFSPTVCQRFFDYSVMTVACGSSHMLVFARPRQQESQEVCLEDEDVTYSYLDRCYSSMLQGQPLEHIADPGPTLVSQPTFLPTSLSTSHRWSLSTRARRRQRESSSAQFGPEFCNLPPPTTGFTALALTGNILQPRSPTDTPKRFKTEASVESASTSITLPAGTPPLPPITKNAEDCHSVGTSENSILDKTHEVNKHSGRVENIPQQAPPTEVQTGSVSHPSVTQFSPPSNLKHKKPRSRDPKNSGMAEEHSSATASRSQTQSKIYKKPIQSTNNKSKSQIVEVRLSPDRMSPKEKEGSSEACSTNTDPRDNISKADKHSKVQHADSRSQEVTALAEMEQETKSSPNEIQKTSFPVEEVKQVRTTPTNVQEVKSPKIKEMGIPVRATKRDKSPVKVQDVPMGATEVSKVESTPQADAQKDIKPSLGKAQEVRSTLINTQEQGNSTLVQIPAKIQSTPKKGKEKNDVDPEESPSELTPKKAKKKRSDEEKAPMSETAPKTPSPLSVSIPTQISIAKKGKPVESENSDFQIKCAMPAQETTDVKRENDSKIPQNSDISFPPIKNRKSGRTEKKKHSASNLQSDHKNSQLPADKVLTEQKHEFPSIKSLAPERGHSFSSSWSNNQSATNKFSATKETELSTGKLSPSPQHQQSPLKENKLSRKTVEPEEPDWKPQAEQSIMGSVVSSLPAVALASAAPLLIKAAEVLSETPPEPSTEMSSVSKETTGSNILLEQEVDQDSTVQDVSAIEETDDNIIKQQNTQDVQNEVVSNENEMWVSGKIEEEEHVKDSETERKEEGGEEESLAEEEDESKGVGQEEENGAVEDEEERENKNYEDRGESAQQGEEDSEEEEGEEEESEAAGEEEDDSGQSSKSEEEMSTGEGSGDEVEREDEEQSEGQEKEEDEEGDTDEKEEEDEESGGTDKEEERESWDEGNEGEVEDGEEEQEGESSNEEKSEAGEQSESDNENKNERSDEEEGESEEKDESEQEEEENETVEGEEEESEEEGEVGNEDEEENQEEESDHEEEEENRDQANEEEEEEENEEEGEEDKEEEVDEEENNEELKDKSEEEEEEESVREKEAEDEEKMSETDGDEEQQEEKEPIEEENREIEEDEKEGKIDTNGEKLRENETQETERGDEDGETDKLNEMKEESGSEEEAEEEEIDQKKENKTTERKQRETNQEEEEEEETEQKEKKNSRKQRETSEEKEEQEEESDEEEEETEQEETNIKTEKNRGKKRESSEEEEEQEEESEEEEEESEQEEKNTKTEKNRGKQRESSEEEEEQEEESEEEEEESEQEEKNTKTEKNRGKQRESSEEEEEQEEESEEQEEEEIEQNEKNIKMEKISRKQRETSEEEEEQSEGDEEEEGEEETEQKEKNTKIDKHVSEQSENNDEEEEQEEEGEDEEEEEAKQKDKNIKIEKNERKQRETSEEEEEAEEEEGEDEEGEEEEGEEEEEEEEKTKKIPKQRAKPDVLPPSRQTNAQRDKQKNRQRHQQNVKGKKQTDSSAQDPQFWNNVLPQYLNLK